MRRQITTPGTGNKKRKSTNKIALPFGEAIFFYHFLTHCLLMPSIAAIDESFDCRTAPMPVILYIRSPTFNLPS
jgi:hypothetical protein